MTKKAQNNSIGNLLIQICKIRRNKSNALLSELGLHSGQDALLYYLSIEDGQTVSSLASKLCIQQATISNMLDRMEASGMIKKLKDTSDKRTSRVYLTANGKEVIKDVSKVWRTMESLTVRDFNDDEKSTLTTLLQKVLNNIE